MKIQIKRVYLDAANRDGHRILVDRLWPRGISKEKARLDDWNKDIAPSSKLRTWFDHKEERFPEFKEKYKSELSQHKDALKEIADIAKRKQVTLLYGAKNEEYNQAIVLKEYLENTF